VTFRGDPFMAPQDTADPWEQRLDRLRRRVCRPWVAVRGEDLTLLLRQLDVWQHQAMVHADENAALRGQLSAAEQQIATLTPKWEPEAA
jgi:hypothetical protein